MKDRVISDFSNTLQEADSNENLMRTPFFDMIIVF